MVRADCWGHGDSHVCCHVHPVRVVRSRLPTCQRMAPNLHMPQMRRKENTVKFLLTVIAVLAHICTAVTVLAVAGFILLFGAYAIVNTGASPDLRTLLSVGWGMLVGCAVLKGFPMAHVLTSCLLDRTEYAPKRLNSSGHMIFEPRK